MIELEKSPREAYELYQRVVIGVRSHTISLHDKSAAGAINADQIDNYIRSIANAKEQMNNLIVTPGLQDYADTETPNRVNYNIVSENTTTVAAIDLFLSWALSEIPKDGSGYELMYTRDANAVKTPRVFGASLQAMVNLRVEMQSILSTMTAA